MIAAVAVKFCSDRNTLVYQRYSADKRTTDNDGTVAAVVRAFAPRVNMMRYTAIAAAALQISLFIPVMSGLTSRSQK